MSRRSVVLSVLLLSPCISACGSLTFSTGPEMEQQAVKEAIGVESTGTEAPRHQTTQQLAQTANELAKQVGEGADPAPLKRALDELAQRQKVQEQAKAVGEGADSAALRQALDELDQQQLDQQEKEQAPTIKELAKQVSEGADPSTLKKALNELDGRREFAGIGFGIAPSVVFGGSREVESAEIVTTTPPGGGTPTSTVRVKTSHQAVPSLLLETHYFFVPKYDDGKTQVGHGPFLSLEVGEDDVIGGLGFGYMVGWRSERGASSRSFNVGIGPFLDRDVQQLAHGFADGQTPPNGETQVAFRSEDEWRWVLMFSFSWGI